MDDWRDQLAQTIDDLRRERDHVRVQLHLGKTEVLEEWTRLETKWASLKEEGDRLSDATRGARQDLAAATKRLAGELKASYARLRRSL